MIVLNKIHMWSTNFTVIYEKLKQITQKHPYTYSRSMRYPVRDEWIIVKGTSTWPLSRDYESYSFPTIVFSLWGVLFMFTYDTCDRRFFSL